MADLVKLVIDHIKAGEIFEKFQQEFGTQEEWQAENEGLSYEVCLGAFTLGWYAALGLSTTDLESS